MNYILVRICKEVALELNMTPAEVEEIFKSQEEFISKAIADGKFNRIRIQGLGLFFPVEYKMKKHNFGKYGKQRELPPKGDTESPSEK